MKALVLALAFAATPALAQNYSCTLVDDFDDWAVEIEISDEVKKAEFWDNDHWSTLDRYEFRLLESNPPQEQHRFFGVDSLDDTTQFAFYFNKTRMTATLSEKYADGTRNSYAFACTAE